MTKNITFAVLFLLTITISFAQNSLNDYKYVIVPNKFDFLNTADEHRLNWLTKSLFESLNFKALMSNDIIPEDLKTNRCLALKADVLKASGLFKTRLTIQLKNCDDQVVYTSQEGTSREKGFKKAYHEALRKAFQFLKAENYSYKPNGNVISNTKVLKEEEKKEGTKEIQKLKEEIKELKAESKPKVVAVKEVKQQPALKKKEAQVVLNTASKVEDSILNTLIASLIPGSLNYIVKDNNGNLIYTLLYSGQQDLYMVKGKDAMVSKVNNTWAITEYVGSDLQIKGLNIKF